MARYNQTKRKRERETKERKERKIKKEQKEERKKERKEIEQKRERERGREDERRREGQSQRQVSSLKDPMYTNFVTTRSLPFGFRSVNRKLQLRLVCNEHNGDSSRVKVGQLGRGKQATARQAARARSRCSCAILYRRKKSKKETNYSRDRLCRVQ